jgi:hypothetical protein
MRIGDLIAVMTYWWSDQLFYRKVSEWKSEVIDLQAMNKQRYNDDNCMARQEMLTESRLNQDARLFEDNDS